MIIEIKEEYIDMRIDRFLKKYLKDAKNSEIFKYIKNGNIKINGKKTKENYRIKNDDLIVVKDIKLDIDNKYNNKKVKNNFNYGKIVYENDDFFIVDKLDFVAMHKGTNNEYGISEYFKNKYNSNDVNFVNRLDYKTSGLVIGAKNSISLRKLSEIIKNKEITKKYIAKSIVSCEDFEKLKYLLNETEVVTKKDDYLMKSNIKIISYEKVNNGYEIIYDIDLITGKKHQIRIQLNSLNSTIVGDDKYGKYKKSDKLYLKCYYLSFVYDKVKYEFKIENSFT